MLSEKKRCAIVWMTLGKLSVAETARLVTVDLSEILPALGPLIQGARCNKHAYRRLHVD